MTHIKICGITRLSDAITAIDAGADLLGFNFYPPSPRSITPAQCAQITKILVKEFPQVTLVGVFVNLPTREISAILQSCSLRLAQLHGDETPQMLAALAGKAFKAFRGVPTLSACVGYTISGGAAAPAFLVDASVQGLYGGSGVTADWPAAAELAKHYPILLAGGLKPENVAAALGILSPWGVDTASGVEARPGEKDPGRIKAFVQAVNSVKK